MAFKPRATQATSEPPRKVGNCPALSGMTQNEKQGRLGVKGLYLWAILQRLQEISPEGRWSER